ncbi:CAP domain-containing protein [Haladaptatus sp. CMAA 1911]|uniref:CAP domain-containing protein n=1 Tax=Haladaptatus sp. CMAA 1911 TaxID=3368987 RepID=UPI003754A30E
MDRGDVERLVHTYVNEERSNRGLEPLAFSTDLREIARYHSEDMATRNYFSHTSPEGENFADRYDRFDHTCRASAGDGRYLTGGENIAQTWYDVRVTTADGTVRYTTEDELARAIVTQWMNSQGHRENILTPEWRNEGIGIVVTDEGKVYATQNFC